MRSTDGIEDGIDPGGELVQCVDRYLQCLVGASGDAGARQPGL
jgi:hypothetical protein